MDRTLGFATAAGLALLSLAALTHAGPIKAPAAPQSSQQSSAAQLAGHARG